MPNFARTVLGVCHRVLSSSRNLSRVIPAALLASSSLLLPATLHAQNVTTQHYDNVRSGSYTTETQLTPSTVTPSNFSRLFVQSVDGQIYAQPLYMQNVSIGGTAHNVVFVATENDTVYAFDADTNGGANATPLWQASMLATAHGAASGATAIPQGDLSTTDITPIVGITGTPVIDPSTNTIYLVSASKEGGSYFQRLHALDITSGAEKFGGPVQLTATISGNGNGSTGGTLTFDQKWENNRSGLLLLNGIVYIAFAAHGDNGPWHGWILAYNAATLKQTSVWCTSANGIGAGIWMSGSGIAADTLNPTGNSPGGRLFVATGNGTFDAKTPYTNNMDYGDSLVRLHLNNGVMTVADDFTPLNQASLNGADQDVASGGVLILPDQTGSHTHELFQTGKEGRFYIVDRDNMGGYSTTADNIAQEIPVNGTSGSFPIPAGIWGMPGFFNNTMYIWGKNDVLKTFPISAGKFPTTASSKGSITVGFPSPTPVISSNAGANPILWSVESDSFGSGNAILRATDPTNIATTLYDSSAKSSDSVGGAVKFTVPTVANGKVYVGASNQLSFYGLSNGQSPTATPVITPGAESFVGSIQVTITDSTPGAKIFYSTTGTASTASTPYTGAITVSSTTTISAIATATGFLQSSATNETYTLQTQTLMPTFSPAPGNYTSAQTVTISDASPNPTIYYAINAPATTSSTKAVGSATVTVSQTETINAIATSGTLTTSPQASATYGIGVPAGSAPSFPVGFSSAASVMTFNGSTDLDDTRLQLTSGLANQAGTAWFNTPQNIQNFTTDFTFQLSNASADGITFAIQNTGLTALGPSGGGLGYGPDTPGGTGGIAKSVAIKFDLYDNDGEGDDSTGLYTNGASPTVPSTDLSTSAIDLHSGDEMSVHMVYNGTTLTMTITDGVTGGTFTTSWTVNIPSIVGANTAFVGFTGGTGGLTSSQKIEDWSFVSTGAQQQQATAPLFSPAAGSYTGTQSVTLTDATPGSTIFYTTNGSTPATTAGGSTLQFSAANPISVAATETIKALATAPGFTTSTVNSATYTITALQPAPTPTIAPATGTYTSAQTVTITDPGATIYYTIDGSAPSPNSTKYTASFVVNATTTVRAIAVESGFSNSAIAQSVITISSGGPGTAAINFGSGFSNAGLQFNGRTKLDATRLELTDTAAQNEFASAFWTTPVNVQSFTNDFTFQLTSPTADGFTFTIQNTGITAFGPSGGGLGYGPDAPGGTAGIGKSVAVKFDLYNNAGEGTNSTGLYTNGASPTTPATTIGGNVSLHSGDILKAHITYDGTTLTLTLTDTTNTAETFTTSWPVNIPSIVGGNTAFVGFTAGTGGSTAMQEILTWTYSAGSTGTAPKTPVVYQTANLAAVSSGPTFRQFTFAPFPDTTGTILDATAAGQSVTMTLNVANAGTYDVKISTKLLNTRGTYQLAINGANVGAPQDEYNATTSGIYATQDLGNFNFAAAGSYSFKFTVTGKNAGSSGFSIAFDDITLTPQ